MPFPSVRRRSAVLATGAAVLLTAAAPAAAKAPVKETLSNFAIKGGSSAKAGSVKFTVANSATFEHEMIVIRTKTKAAKLKVVGGKASEKGSVGEVEVAGGATKTLKLKLKKGHYALICNIGNHYTAGMRKDFTVK